MSKGFDSNKIKGGMVVRSRQQGDKIKLAGGSKKLKICYRLKYQEEKM